MNSGIVSLLSWKLRALFSGKNHFSANVIDSSIDKTAAVRNHVRIYHSALGRYSYVARDTLIQNTEIGSFCSIAEGCNIGMPSHPVGFVSTSPVFLHGGNYLKTNLGNIEYQDCPRTHIGNDVWIGAHAQIKSGIRIGNGAVIGAEAVVTRDVPPYAIAGGVTARIIRYRFDRKICSDLNESKWWEKSDKELRELSSCITEPQAFLEKIDKKIEGQ